MTTDQAKPTRGLCAQCGLEVEIDVPPDGHTRPAHDSPSTHDEQGNCRTCPIPVLCGPVIVDDMSEAKPTELLPCPFCGGKAKWGKGEQKIKYGNEQVYCDNCCAITAPEMTKAEAAAWWNQRTPSPAQAEWQPIESAPKEGRIILGGEGKSAEGEWWQIDKMWSVDFEPSHWQPRPQPPK